MVQRQISYIVPSQGAVGLKDESCDAGVGKDDTADLGTAVNTSEEPLVTVRLACAFIDANAFDDVVCAVEVAVEVVICWVIVIADGGVVVARAAVHALCQQVEVGGSRDDVRVALGAGVVVSPVTEDRNLRECLIIIICTYRDNPYIIFTDARICGDGSRNRVRLVNVIPNALKISAEYEHGIIIFYQYTYLIIYKNDGSLAFDRLKQFPDEVCTSHAAEALLDVAALVGLVPEEIFALGKLFAWGMG